MTATHKQRAEAAYGRYTAIQARIAAFEAGVSRAYPDNDRQVAAYLKNTEIPEVWVYQTLCKQRAVQEQIIATETAMASLYNY